VGTALRPLLVKASGFVANRIVSVGDFFRKVVPILLQAVAGVQLGVLAALCDGSKVIDTEVDTGCFVAGGVERLDLAFANEVQFPLLFLVVVDGSDLL
jgi:hypothetical protein